MQKCFELIEVELGKALSAIFDVRLAIDQSHPQADKLNEARDRIYAARTLCQRFESVHRENPLVKK